MTLGWSLNLSEPLFSHWQIIIILALFASHEAAVQIKQTALSKIKGT